MISRHFAVLAALVVAGCSGADSLVALPSEEAQSSLGLPNRATADTLAVGGTRQLTASLPQHRGKTQATPTEWPSSNAAVATVTQGGLVTAVAPGTSLVKATNNLATEQATIVVYAPTTPPPTDTATTPPPPPPSTAGVAAPALPQSYVNTATVAVTGSSIQVPAGGNFQTALDAAKPGDEIVLAAGATYAGNFNLGNKSGTGWITIRGSAPPSSVPAAGQRITPAYASALPKIVTPNGNSAIITAPGAHHFRFVGVEITVAAGVGSTNALVAIGTSGDIQNTLAAVPHDFVFERVYIHGNSTVSFSRCVALNSAWSAVIDSHLSDCHSSYQDSQAIAAWNGPGPFKIVNNYLEGAGENVMFGGGDPGVQGMIPSDIEIRRNHFFKPLSWQNSSWVVKNLFELKNARRVLVEGNVFENHWAAAQNGFALLWKSENQDGTAPWTQTSDVTFQYNVVRRVAAAINLAGLAGENPAVRAERFRIANNVFEQIGDPVLLQGTGTGRLFQVIAALAVEYAHNTGVGTTNGLLLVGAPTSNSLVMRDNVFGGGKAIASADGRGYGIPALDYHVPGWKVQGNTVLGAPTTSYTYPTNNLYAASTTAAGLSSDLRVIAAPALGSATTDGLPVGADRAMVEQKTAGVVGQ